MRLSFGEKMRVMMKRRGVSVQEVADRLGVSRQNVNQRLNADKFTLEDMEKYAAAIGCGIEIEITERVHDEKNFEIKTVISKLRSAGFIVAIDDFGTEYANLALLSDAEFDILKLDKSLISNVALNPRTKIIMEYISKICHRLGVDMIAEGIESEEQFFTL